MNHIETQRLILRHFTEEDINALFSILSDKDVNTFLPMFPLKDIEEAKDYLQYIKSWIQQKGFYYAICMKTNNVPIGCIHINGDDSHDLGYSIKKEFLAQRDLYRSLSGSNRYAETNKYSLYHSYARCKQSEKWKSYAGYRHEIPIFL